MKPNRCSACGAEWKPGASFCVKCGAKFEMKPIHTDPVSRKDHRPSRNIFAVISAVLLVLCICLGIFGFSKFAELREIENSMAFAGFGDQTPMQALYQLEASRQALTEDLSEAEETVTQQADLLAKQDQTIRQLQDKIDLLEPDSELYHTVIDFIREPDAGYADENFHSVRPVYVMDVDDQPATFTLTSSLGGGGTTYYEPSGESAYISAVEESFYSTTPIRITPLKPGITYITFSNSHNDLTFRVMVLVVDE